MSKSKDRDEGFDSSHCSVARIKRTMYGSVWECVKPGLWKSVCGWYSARFRCKQFWEGRDLETGKEVYGNSLTDVAYQFRKTK